MRRLTFLAAALAVACHSSSSDSGGDHTPPAAPVVLAPAGGATLGGHDLVGGKVAFSGTAEAGARVDLLVDGAGAGSAVAASSGAWSIAAALADGTHAAQARATDAAGNVSAPSAATTFALDATPPVPPAVLFPGPGAILGPSELVAGLVVFSGTAEPGATVRLEVDGAPAGAVAAGASGAWSLAVQVAGGAHSVAGSATDAAGNASLASATIAFTLDLLAPAVPVVLAPRNGARLDASQLVAGEVVFSGTADAGSRVELQLDGAAVATAIASAGGAWSVAATVAAGSHAARARATGPGGVSSGLSAPTAFALYGYRLAGPLPAGSPLPLSTWAQTVADTAGLGEVFPGQANTWVIEPDYALGLGFGTEYVHALILFAGTPTSPMTHESLLADVMGSGSALHGFPLDQTIGEATFLTPLFTAADGVVTAAVSDGAPFQVTPFSGAWSGFLAGTADSRLSRTLPLAAGQDYTLTWSDRAEFDDGLLGGAGAAPWASSYQVVLRDGTTGEVTKTLYTFQGVQGGHSAPVVLSFELRSGPLGFAQIDDVALTDANGQAISVANGDFEAGTLSGWTASAGAQSQDVRSGSRAVGTGASALSVTRTVYAPPAATWARIVDVLENAGADPVTTSAVYLTQLNVATPHVAARQSGAALVGWDPARSARDVGVVSGAGTVVVEDGSPFAFVVHALTVPPGGRLALVHFVVQLGGADGGATVADVPAPTDAECARVAAGFPGVEAYAVDLEPGVLGLVQNF